MTCIIALKTKGKVTIGGDSMASTDFGYYLMGEPKVFKKGDFMFGYCGSIRVGKIIQYAFKIPEHQKNMSTDKYLQTEFSTSLRKCLKEEGFTRIKDNVENLDGYSEILICYRGNVWYLHSDFSISKTKGDYITTGSGYTEASAAMYILNKVNKVKTPKEKVILALEAVESVNPSVKGPFNILEQKGEVK